LEKIKIGSAKNDFASKNHVLLLLINSSSLCKYGVPVIKILVGTGKSHFVLLTLSQSMLLTVKLVRKWQVQKLGKI
jgi:hypothetical protein